jgi:hypothetical protein
MATTQLSEEAYREKMHKAARAAVSDAIETHRRMGRSIVIWRDGQIVTVPPDQIPPRPLSSEESSVK